MSSLKNAVLTTLLTGALTVGAGLALPKLSSGAVQLPSLQPQAGQQQPAQQAASDDNPGFVAPAPGSGQAVTEPQAPAIPQAVQFPDDNPGAVMPTIPANEPPPATELLALPSSFPVFLTCRPVFFLATGQRGDRLSPPD